MDLFSIYASVEKNDRALQI